MGVRSCVCTRACACLRPNMLAPPTTVEITQWFVQCCSLFVVQTIGLLVGATVTNMKTAMSLLTVMMLCIMLVAGFYVKNIPVWIKWLRYL